MFGPEVFIYILFDRYCFNFLYFSSNFIFIPFQFLDAIKERKSLKKIKKKVFDRPTESSF